MELQNIEQKLELRRLQNELKELLAEIGANPVKRVMPLNVRHSPQGLVIPPSCSGERLSSYIAAYGLPPRPVFTTV